MSSKRFLQVALLSALILLALACRTAETIAQLRPAQATSRPRGTLTATRRPTRLAQVPAQDTTPTAIVAITDVPPPTDEPEQPPLPPEDEPAAEPTRRPVVVPTNPPAPPTDIPPPPTPSFPYRIRESRCGPNVRTFIEGYVYEGSVGRNDLLVRISQGPDGIPDPNDDFRTGSDTKKGKGYYFHNINIGAPHGGKWYLWVIDPETMQRISEIAIVETHSERIEDSGTSSGSCQSATVIFSTQPLVPTPRPSNTPRSQNEPEPTQDPGNDSD